MIVATVLAVMAITNTNTSSGVAVDLAVVHAL